MAVHKPAGPSGPVNAVPTLAKVAGFSAVIGTVVHVAGAETRLQNLLGVTSPNLAPEFALVVAGGLILQWKALHVNEARHRLKVHWPTMYLPDDGSARSHEFNCVQRAHQNSLEFYPQFVALTMISGSRFPLVTFLAGSAYLGSRVIFARNYYTGDVAKRGDNVRLGYLGLFLINGLAMVAAAEAFRASFN